MIEVPSIVFFVNNSPMPVVAADVEKGQGTHK